MTKSVQQITVGNEQPVIFSVDGNLHQDGRLKRIPLNSHENVLSLARTCFAYGGGAGSRFIDVATLMGLSISNEEDFLAHKDNVYDALMSGKICAYQPINSRSAQNVKAGAEHHIDKDSAKNDQKKQNKSKQQIKVNKHQENNDSDKVVTKPALANDKSGTSASGKKNTEIKCTPQNGCPISMITGEELLEHVDVNLPFALELQWKRIYRSSQSHINNGLGFGWCSPYDLELIEDESSVIFINHEGRRIPFSRPSLHQSSIQLTESLELSRSQPQEYLLTLSDHKRWVFRNLNGRWRPTVCYDLNGNKLSFEYDDSFRLAKVQASNQRCLVIKRDGVGHVLSVTPGLVEKGSGLKLISQSLVKYQYDSQGDLIGAIDAQNGAEQYQYENHLFVQRQIKSGYQYYFEWDGKDRYAKCIRQWGDDGYYDYHFEYDELNKTTYSTDGRGVKETYQYNDNGLLVEYTDGQGNKTSHEYDEHNRLWSTTNALGQVESYRYDVRGRLISTQDIEGLEQTHQYNDLNHPVTYTDANGAQWKRQYDFKNRLTAIIDPLGRKKSFEYLPSGQLSVVRFSDESQEQFFWSQKGELIEKIDRSGGKTQYNYTDLGQINQILQPNNQVVHYAYHGTGQVAGIAKYYLPESEQQSTGVVDEKRQQWLFNYDKAGRLIEYIEPGNKTTKWQYQGLAQVTKRINPDGSTLHYEYDEERNLKKLTNENGEQYHFDYDENERLIKEVGFDGRVQSYQYNALGYLTESIDGSDELRKKDEYRQQRFIRDKKGRLLQKVSFNAQLQSSETADFQYDKLGRLIAANNESRKLSFNYDKAGQLKGELQDKALLRHEYDVNGQRSKSIFPDGKIAEYKYTTSGQLEEIQLDGKIISQFERDNVGREVAKQLGNGLYQTQQFDSLGQLVEQSLHKVKEKTLIQRQYGYNEAGNISTISDLSGDINFEYDKLDQLTNVSGLIEQQFSFDPAGNILSNKKEDNKEPVKADGESEKVESTSDLVSDSTAKNRITEFNGKQFEYDFSGNLTQITDEEGNKTSLLYDGSNQLIRSRKKGIVTDYKYDALGRRISKMNKTGFTSFLWNGDVLLSEELNGAEGQEKKTYLFEPDSFIPVAQITESKDQSQTQFIHNDHLGTPIGMTDESGELIWQARYKVYGELDHLEAQENVSCNIRFQGQYFDDETALHYNRFRYYSPDMGRFISQDPIGLLGGINNYQYAPNPVQWVDPFGLSCKETKKLPPGVNFEGTVYRYEDPSRIDTTWDAHKWNKASDHRYTGPGQSGVYAGTSAETAKAEISHYGALNGRELVSKDTKLENVLDLTDPKTRDQLGVSIDDISGNSYEATHKIGNFAKENGYNGILAPSARNPGGANLISFDGY